MEHAGKAKIKKAENPQVAIEKLQRLHKEAADAIKSSIESRVEMARTVARIENIALEGEDERLGAELRHIIDELEKTSGKSAEAEKLTQELEEKSARMAEIKRIIDERMDAAEARVRGK